MEIVIGIKIDMPKDKLVKSIESALSGMLLDDLNKLSDNNPFRNVYKKVNPKSVSNENIYEVLEHYGDVIITKGTGIITPMSFNKDENPDSVYISLKE